MRKQTEGPLKIRRVQQSRSLRDVPLDGVDMFLLSLVEDEIELSELSEIAQRNALECLQRVLRLGQLGLLRLRFDSQDERLLAQGCDEAAAQELLDNANTMRPPPGRWPKSDERKSAPRPSAPRVLLSELNKPQTGMRRRPTPPQGMVEARGSAREQSPVKIDKAAG